MENDKIASFAELLAASAAGGGLYNVTFHAPAGGDVLKIRGTLREIGGARVVQLESFLTEGRVSQKNVAPDGLEAAVREAMTVFRKADLLDAGGSASLMISKKGALSLVKKGKIGMAPVNPAAIRSAPQGNDRKKRRLLAGDEKFLIPLGISDKSGRVHDAMQSKFRQIERFSEYVAEAEKKLGGDGTLYVCDLCCGKSYLSFAAYHVLTAVCGREVEMVCVDLKESVMNECAEIARACGFGGMRFIAGNVADFKPEREPDLVISLHACDTATDLVLDLAAAHGAKIILATPCCQRDLAARLDCGALDFIADRPILKQKFCAAATDALRLLKLEAQGYKTDATELIDPEDTPKNVMLRAVRREDFDPASEDAKRRREKYESAYRFLTGTDPRTA
ncbi:MAG: SAM-dependent methyltransferase [Clostridia bacterium]|nr:SAM-dependent methyltransferase [Clostridia bacterium]